MRPLLERGLPVDAAPYGYPMLYMAAAQGNNQLVHVLLLCGADMQKHARENGTTAIEARLTRTPSTHGVFDFHFSSKIIPIVIPI